MSEGVELGELARMGRSRIDLPLCHSHTIHWREDMTQDVGNIETKREIIHLIVKTPHSGSDFY